MVTSATAGIAPFPTYIAVVKMPGALLAQTLGRVLAHYHLAKSGSLL